nr:unnamed protein product [Fasciola hepatica]
MVLSPKHLPPSSPMYCSIHAPTFLRPRDLTVHVPEVDQQTTTASDDDSLYFNKRPRHLSSSSTKPFRLLKSPYASIDNCRTDKRARDEHNEQERSRRRELAVIYELIRCSFSEDDLRYLEPYSGPKSIDKLSYPQVLQVAYHLLREEEHNLMLFERTLDEIKRIEKELVHVGLSVPQRPFYPSISDGYFKVVQVVDSLLKHDKKLVS